MMIASTVFAGAIALSLAAAPMGAPATGGERGLVLPVQMEGEVSEPVSTEVPPLAHEPDTLPCAAIAVDPEGAAYGAGQAATIEAAREMALKECKGQNVKHCSITSASCDPLAAK